MRDAPFHASNIYERTALFFGCILFSVAAAAPAAADDYCRAQGPRFRLTSPGPWPRHITVKSGAGCINQLAQVGKNIIQFQRVTLMDRPKTGTVTLHENGSIVYKAKAGYAGADTFTLEVCGRQNDVPGCATIDFSVTVE